MPPIHFIIITGQSGAGKSEAVKCFEDLSFFCVDNLPPALIGKFAELCAESGGKIDRVALVIDIRGGGFFDDIADALKNLERLGVTHEIIFLEAEDTALVRRFKESRRRHPLSASGSIIEGIQAEKTRLEQLRSKAAWIIDTTQLTARELRRQITAEYGRPDTDRLNVSIVSFGFKHGLPLDADLVFDLRFLPNPHYVESLRDLTGNDPRVIEYIMKWPLTTKFLNRLQDLLGFLLPQYHKEGRANLVVAVGCTGGQHRSIVIANRLAAFLQDRGFQVHATHRDIDRKQPDTAGEA